MQSCGHNFEKKHSSQLFGNAVGYIDVPEKYSIACPHEYDFQQMDDSDTLFVNKWYAPYL